MKQHATRTRRLFNRIIDVRSWSDWDRTKAYTAYLSTSIKKFLIPQKKVAGESFAQAKKRMKLSDTDLIVRKNGLLRLSILMISVAFLLLIYAIYQLIYGSLFGAILSLVVTNIALVLAFRYHFWYFQIKKQKLGCTFREWLREGLTGEKL